MNWGSGAIRTYGLGCDDLVQRRSGGGGRIRTSPPHPTPEIITRDICPGVRGNRG